MDGETGDQELPGQQKKGPVKNLPHRATRGKKIQTRNLKNLFSGDYLRRAMPHHRRRDSRSDGWAREPEPQAAPRDSERWAD